MQSTRYLPDTCDEAYVENREAVVAAMSREAPWIVQTPRPDTVEPEPASIKFLDIDPDVMVLDVHKFRLPAAWTEMPYEWRYEVAVDYEGRHVATPARIYWTDDFIH